MDGFFAFDEVEKRKEGRKEGRKFGIEASSRGKNLPPLYNFRGGEIHGGNLFTGNRFRRKLAYRDSFRIFSTVTYESRLYEFCLAR